MLDTSDLLFKIGNIGYGNEEVSLCVVVEEKVLFVSANSSVTLKPIAGGCGVFLLLVFGTIGGG
jgi:hypothetical protein